MAGNSTMRWMAAGALVMLASGCDMLGIETPAKQQAAAEAEGKAVGSACRHAGRAIEDCFTLNPKANKAAVFAGWKEMNDYMTKNKIEVVQPQLARGGKETPAPTAAADPLAAPAGEKPAAQTAKSEKSDKGEKARAPEKVALPTPPAPASMADNPDDVVHTKVAPVADSSVNAARARAHAP